MRKKVSILLALSISILITIPPATAGNKTPEDALKGFDKWAEQIMKEWKIPGMAVAVIKDDKVILSKGYGWKDLEKKLKVTPKTLFAIASTTKAFTAAVMSMLVDQGKMEWHKPVRDYLPEFRLYDKLTTEQMTPLDLVSHRSGLPRHDLMWYHAAFSRKELLSRLRYLPPSKGFRETWQYQNLMYMTAGCLIEKIQGTTWEEAVRTMIFESLGMNSSNFSVRDSQKAADYALPYKKDKNENIVRMPFCYMDALGPAGSINSNIEDMAKWVKLQLNKGKYKGKQLISEAQMELMHMPLTIVPRPMKYDEVFYQTYGLGWFITSYRGHLVLQHGGNIDGFTALVSLAPRDKIGVVIFLNMNVSPVRSIVCYNIYDRLFGLNEVDWSKRTKERIKKDKKAKEKKAKDDTDRKANTKPTHAMKEYAGEYEHPGYGIIKIGLKNGKLLLSFNSIKVEPEHYHHNVFTIKHEEFNDNAKLVFVSDLKGNISSLKIPVEPAMKPLTFNKLPDKSMSEKKFLERFVGKYQILTQILTVSLREDGKLILIVQGQPNYEMIPYRGKEFNLKGLSGFSIEFIEENGNITKLLSKQPKGTFKAKKIE